MTDTEKELHPEHETTGGYLKTIHIAEAAKNGLKPFRKTTKRQLSLFQIMMPINLKKMLA